VNPWTRLVGRSGDLMTRSVDRQRRRDRTLVAEPGRERRLMVQAALTFVAALTCFNIVVWAPLESPWGMVRVVGATGLGWVIGMVPMRHLGRAMSYRSGWLDGRSAMVSSLSEALRRGLTLEDWVHGEAERDFKMLMHEDGDQ
jgi:hypothetical protein